jgi:hypothetical protein
MVLGYTPAASRNIVASNLLGERLQLEAYARWIVSILPADQVDYAGQGAVLFEQKWEL